MSELQQKNMRSPKEYMYGRIRWLSHQGTCTVTKNMQKYMVQSPRTHMQSPDKRNTAVKLLQLQAYTAALCNKEATLDVLRSCAIKQKCLVFILDPSAMERSTSIKNPGL